MNRKTKKLFISHMLTKWMFNLELIYVLIALFFFGCVSENSMRRDITIGLRETSLLMPYLAEKFYAADYDFVLETLINCLNSQGARILFWNKEASIVSWYDTGGSFVPMPGASNKANKYELTAEHVTFWSGYVYGSGRIVTTDVGSWLSIRTVGRDVTSGQRVFSDGTYERKIIGLVDRKIHRIATGQILAPKFQKSKSIPFRHSQVNYEEVFKSGFRNFPIITNYDISLRDQGENYPVSADRLWRACQDVILQYAIVPYFHNRERVIAFSRRVPVPINITAKKVKPVDVILVVTISEGADNSEPSSKLFISMLGKDDLKPYNINKKLSENEDSVDVKLIGQPIEIAAAIIANELVKQIDIQLFYNENLGNKLLRRIN